MAAPTEKTDVLVAADRIITNAWADTVAQVRAEVKLRNRPCARCGHRYATHIHQRTHPGTDCGSCGRNACPAFQRATWRARLRRWWNSPVVKPWATRRRLWHLRAQP